MPLQILHMLAFGWLAQYSGGFTAISFTETRMVGTTEEDACGSILVLSNMKITWLEPHKQQVQVAAIRGDLSSPPSIHRWLELGRVW